MSEKLTPVSPTLDVSCKMNRVFQLDWVLSAPCRKLESWFTALHHKTLPIVCGFFSSLISVQLLGCSFQLILQMRGLPSRQWVQVSSKPCSTDLGSKSRDHRENE